MHTPRINLSDLYAYVGEKIYNWNGFKEVSELSEQSAFSGYYDDDTWKPSRLFCGASNIYNDYMKGFYSGEEYVTLIIPGLREVYSENKDSLNSSELTMFFESMEKDIPKFKNVSEYDSINTDEDDIAMFQLMGDITPYDVLHIQVETFIKVINLERTFKFKISPFKYEIDIYYDRSDMYDPESDSIILDS